MVKKNGFTKKQINTIVCSTFFVLLVIKLFLRIQIEGIPFTNQTMPYVLSYQKIGFAARVFVGTIINIFTDYLTLIGVYKISIAIHILIYLLYAVILYSVLNKLEKFPDARNTVLYLAAFAVLFPFSTIFGGGRPMFTDEILIAFSVLSIFLIYKLPIKFIYVSIVPIILAILTHYITIFYIYPAVFICLYIRLVNDNKYDSRKLIHTMVIYNVILLMIFAYIFFFAIKNSIEYEDLRRIYNSSLDVGEKQGGYLISVYEYEHADIRTKFRMSTIGQMRNPKTLILSVITIAFSYYILILFAKNYISLFFASKDTRFKILYAISFLSIFAIGPLFIGCDFPRWLQGAITVQIIILIYYLVTYCNDEKINSFVLIKNNKDAIRFCILLFVVALLNCGDSSNVIGYMDAFGRIYDILITLF